MDVSNVWSRRVGGFICGGVRSAAISDAVTARRVSMRRSMRRRRGIRLLPASNRERTGSTITRRRAWSEGRSWHRRTRIRKISPCPGRAGGCRLIGRRCCTKLTVLEQPRTRGLHADRRLLMNQSAGLLIGAERGDQQAAGALLFGVSFFVLVDEIETVFGAIRGVSEQLG